MPYFSSLDTYSSAVEKIHKSAGGKRKDEFFTFAVDIRCRASGKMKRLLRSKNFQTLMVFDMVYLVC